MHGEFREILLWLWSSGLRIVVIGAGSIQLIRLLRAVVDRIPRLMPAGMEPVNTEREKRAHALASLLRTVGTTLVLIVGVMMVLREIGWDITPLIAGYFILLDDQFHVGGVIQAAGVSGQVEPMTRRTTIVRDLQRTVHFVPNGRSRWKATSPRSGPGWF